MKNLKYYIGLSEGTWIAFVLAIMLIYGGLHPTAEMKNIIFIYCGLLILFLNIPLGFYLLFLGLTEHYFKTGLWIGLIVKMGLGFWLFTN